MPSMDNLIAEYYAQNDSADSDVEKQAQVELFAKLAADNGIDLAQLSEDQIGYLWSETFKTAAEAHEGKETPEEEEAEKKVEEAKKEHEKKKEAAAKVAEADFLGRYMAHAMTDEIQKIAGAREAVGRAGKAVGEHLESVGKRIGGMKAERMTGAHGGTRELLTHRLQGGAAKAVGGGAYAAGAAGAAGGGVALKKHLDKKKAEKTASAIDELAAESAVEKAASAGWDAEEAAARISSVLTLGVEESTKIAFAQDLAGAVDVRSLELLEAAGYPVTWSE